MPSSIKRLNNPIFYRKLRPIGIDYFYLVCRSTPEHHSAGRIRLAGALCGRERGQLSANLVQREEFLASLGQTINELILSHRVQFEDMDFRQHARWYPPPFEISRSRNEPKPRWVDGTAEYAFYICALRKLFPQALFVHLLETLQT